MSKDCDCSICKRLRLADRAKKLIENPPRCVVEKTDYLTEKEIMIAHKYYNWAYLDCLDMLEVEKEKLPTFEDMRGIFKEQGEQNEGKDGEQCLNNDK